MQIGLSREVSGVVAVVIVVLSDMWSLIVVFTCGEIGYCPTRVEEETWEMERGGGNVVRLD